MAIGLVTGDGLLHPLLGVPRRLGDTDLAIVLFRSAIEYKIAPLSLEAGSVSEPVLAVGFPAGAEFGGLVVTESIKDTRHVIHPSRNKKPVSDETCPPN
ncbi:hypothetical protein [Microcoleus sp. AT3-D2]|uniref:hypothetical protein n=1 Tax=Microcoleus sp. AT3-D2 TaxID=2818612 RepID=UPI002FCEF983